MLIYAGIDEAGYGPMLGPLTVGCVSFCLAEHEPDSGPPAMWSLLRRAVCRDIKSARGRIVINDSKKLKLPLSSTRRHPLTHLERGVLAFLACTAEATAPESDIALFEIICPGLAGQLEQLEWYAGEPITLPVAHDRAQMRITVNALHRALDRTGIKVERLGCAVMTEGQFNVRVQRLRSKSATSFGIVAGHLSEILATSGASCPRVIVDRQGARMYYREPLQMLFPDQPIQIIAERDDLSRYRLGAMDHGLVVTFQPQAEGHHFPVALASMTAKYVRELMMLRFNRFFRSHMPELRPTAGYVQDARRFLADVEPVICNSGLDRSVLIRQR